ncbi:hypothetical protein HFO56_33475 [Rhizobium laguerreae]|uniref:hypothetical protein n=1 Tax=Rhizobium laguerreae TaxID=1076926 RepID=UPI001C8FAF26|nr:hypothetical protein [Rhizobium laguerreae]MBY3157238.1 hypothetical protein [Rhizobium laguerreae]MBY3432911.1 hypothetical protein [Rhizobium laguerreae]
MAEEQKYETYISVHEGIEALAGILGARINDADDVDGPVRYAEFDVHPVRYTLFSYRDRPAYSHLLSSKPFDQESIATFLSRLGVPEEMIDVAVDDERMPLQDIDAIRERVAKLRVETRH